MQKHIATLAAGILAATGAFTTARADHGPVRSISGERWQSACDHSPRVCEARMLGEIDGVLVGMHLSKGKPWICMPNNVDARVRRAVVEKYLDNNPEALSASFGDAVAAALAHAYPCH